MSLFHKPDMANPDVDIAFMKEQLAVGSAIASSPSIRAYVEKQAELEAYELLNFKMHDMPAEIVKSKLATIQGSYNVYRHLLGLSTPAALEAMTQKIHEATTSN